MREMLTSLGFDFIFDQEDRCCPNVGCGACFYLSAVFFGTVPRMRPVLDKAAEIDVVVEILKIKVIFWKLLLFVSINYHSRIKRQLKMDMVGG